MTDRFAHRGFAGLPLDHCLVIDAHGHLGEGPFIARADRTLAQGLRRMDALGVDVFCCSTSLAYYNQARLGNDLTIAAVRQHPTRIFGYMCADVGYPGAVAPELERCLAAGLRGVKIFSHSVRSGFRYADPAFQPVFAFADAHSLPLLAHTFSVQELGDLEPQFARYPHVRFILAHAGSCGIEPYVRLARAYNNVYIETCLSSCPRGLFETLVAEGVTDKVLWGSDAFFMDSSQQLGRLVFAQIPEDGKRRIIGANAARVLGIVLPVV